MGADKHGGNGGSRPFGDGRPPVVIIPRGCLGCEMGGNHDGGVLRGRANHDGGVDRGYDNNNGCVVYGRDKNAMVASSAAAPSDLARCDKPVLNGVPTTIVTSAVAMPSAPEAHQICNVGGGVAFAAHAVKINDLVHRGAGTTREGAVTAAAVAAAGFDRAPANIGRGGVVNTAAKRAAASSAPMAAVGPFAHTDCLSRIRRLETTQPCGSKYVRWQRPRRCRRHLRPPHDCGNESTFWWAGRTVQMCR